MHVCDMYAFAISVSSCGLIGVCNLLKHQRLTSSNGGGKVTGRLAHS